MIKSSRKLMLLEDFGLECNLFLFVVIIHTLMILYCYKLNEEAQERYESLLVDFAESHGLTEELKAKDQMKWVQLANYVANAAKEIVESEVIFR